MAKKIKKPTKVVIHQAYYDLLLCKAELLDELFDDGTGTLVVNNNDLKERALIRKAWDKASDAGISFASVLYTEPK